MKMKSIDVVIPTKNSMPNLPTLIKAIKKDVPVNRIIVVDGHSTDGTIKYSRNTADIIIEQQGEGVGEARQLALEQVETPIYASFDSDIEFPHGWFKKIIKHMDDPDVAVASGKVIFGEPGCKPIADMRRYQYTTPTFNAHTLANTLQRTALIHKLGGFDPKLRTGEDTDLYLRMQEAGFKWIIDREVTCKHPRTFWEYLVSMFRWSFYTAKGEIPMYRLIYGRIRESIGHGLWLGYNVNPHLAYMISLRNIAWLLGCMRWRYLD